MDEELNEAKNAVTEMLLLELVSGASPTAAR